jgi:hypothetical protein
LAYAVHLIVVPAVWKCEKLCFEICKPWRLVWEEHLAVLELCGLYGHSDFLVVLGLDRDDREIRRLEFLDQRCPHSGIFNQDVGGLMQLRLLKYLRPQGREVEPAA